jgi:hypothetical protein
MKIPPVMCAEMLEHHYARYTEHDIPTRRVQQKGKFDMD